MQVVWSTRGRPSRQFAIPNGLLISCVTVPTIRKRMYSDQIPPKAYILIWNEILHIALILKHYKGPKYTWLLLFGHPFGSIHLNFRTSIRTLTCSYCHPFRLFSQFLHKYYCQEKFSYCYFESAIELQVYYFGLLSTLRVLVIVEPKENVLGS